VDVFPGSHTEGHHRDDAAFGGIFHGDGGIAVLTHGQRDQGFAVGPRQNLGQVEADQVAQRGQQVDGRDGRGDEAGGQFRGGDHQGHAGGAFEEGHLEPQAAAAQHFAVV